MSNIQAEWLHMCNENADNSIELWKLLSGFHGKKERNLCEQIEAVDEKSITRKQLEEKVTKTCADSKRKTQSKARQIQEQRT